MKNFVYKVRIRESLLDTYGHVNNASYITLFEEARWEFLMEKGCSVYDIMNGQWGPIILDLSAHFKKELKAREWIDISVQVVEYRHKIGKIRQQMVKENGDVACEGLFTFGIFDKESRKLVKPDEYWRDVMGITEFLKNSPSSD